MNVLVLNCGSSSVKFRLIATDLDLIAQNADQRLAKGTIERIGGEAIIRLQVEGHDPQRSTSSLRDINLVVAGRATAAGFKASSKTITIAAAETTPTLCLQPTWQHKEQSTKQFASLCPR